MPTIKLVALNGADFAKITSINDAQAAQFIALAAAVDQARETLRPAEAQENVKHVSGQPDEIHPLTVRALLPRLDEILGKRYIPASMSTNANKNDPALDHTGQPIAPVAASLRSSVSASGDYLGAARTIGLLLANENQPYNYAELVGGPTVCRLRWR